MARPQAVKHAPDTVDEARIGIRYRPVKACQRLADLLRQRPEGWRHKAGRAQGPQAIGIRHQQAEIIRHTRRRHFQRAFPDIIAHAGHRQNGARQFFDDSRNTCIRKHNVAVRAHEHSLPGQPCGRLGIRHQPALGIDGGQAGCKTRRPCEIRQVGWYTHREFRPPGQRPS